MSSLWTDAAISLGSAVVGGGGFGTLVGHLFKRMAKDAVEAGTADIRGDLKELALKFAAEHGGNSGGIRQEVNAQGKDLAALKGAFEQFTKANPTP